MKFGVLIKDGQYTHQAMDSAYNFIVAAMELGHEIKGVFFTTRAFAIPAGLWSPRGMSEILETCF